MPFTPQLNKTPNCFLIMPSISNYPIEGSLPLSLLVQLLATHWGICHLLPAVGPAVLVVLCLTLLLSLLCLCLSLAFNALPSYSHNLHVYNWHEMLSKNYPGSHLGNMERWIPLWSSLQEWVILINGLLSLASSSGKWGYWYYLPQKIVVKTKWDDALHLT